MLITLDKREFDGVCREKKRQRDAFLPVAWRTLGAISACWMSELGPTKVAIMLYIFNRTLYYRKAADQIWRYQFLKGIVDRDNQAVCDGLGIAEPTLKKHLNELCDKDFLIVYRAEIRDTEYENTPRLYEINFKKLCQPYVIGGDDVSKLKQAKQNPAPKSFDEGDGGSNFDGGEGKNFGGQNSLPHNNSYKRLTKVNLSARAPRSGTVDAGVETNRPALNVPKQKRMRPEATPVYVDPDTPSAREVVATIQRQQSEQRAARVAKASTVQPWMLSKQELQAMIDTQMAAYHPGEPRMIVTGKEYGFLKKELKARQPKDFTGFLKYVFVHWTMIASQHSNAVKRNEDRRYKEKSIPRSPCFKTLVYRLPYFLSCHSNHQADRAPVEKVEDDNREIKRLQRQLTQAQREAQVLKQRSNAKPREQEPDEYEPARKRYTRTPALKIVEDRHIDLGDDAMGSDGKPLLTWEETQQRKDAERKKNVG